MPGMGGLSFTNTNPLVVSLSHHSAFETSDSLIIAIAPIFLVVTAGTGARWISLVSTTTTMDRIEEHNTALTLVQ